MRVCDNCKRLPEAFETDTGDIGWFFVIPNDGDSPVFLMSNLEYAFGVCIDRNPPDDFNNKLICEKCMDSIMEEF